MSHVPVPQRVVRALELIRPKLKSGRLIRPGLSYNRARDRLMREFDISDTTAERDMAAAYGIVKGEIERTDYPSVVRAEMEMLAKLAVHRGGKGDYAVARAALSQLGKWSGMEDGDEDSLVKKLSDAALEVAIKSAAKEAMASMSDEEFEALAKQRKERAA